MLILNSSLHWFSSCFIKIKYSVYCEVLPRMYLYCESEKIISSNIQWIWIYPHSQSRPFRTNCLGRSEEWLKRKGETSWKAQPHVYPPVLNQIPAGSSPEGVVWGTSVSLRSPVALPVSFPIFTLIKKKKKKSWMVTKGTFILTVAKITSVIKIKFMFAMVYGLKLRNSWVVFHYKNLYIYTRMTWYAFF